MMRLKTALASGLFTLILSGLIVVWVGWTEALNLPFPAYGSGPVEVRIYTDYFCPPCRAMEPAVEPLLKDLLKKNVIRLTLVDTPFSRASVLYARYFLYALNAKHDFEHALGVRNTLFAASSDRTIKTVEKIEELFKSKKIPYAAFEPKPVFDQYNALIQEDNIHETPSCVIIKGGQKEIFAGGADIVKALKGLK